MVLDDRRLKVRELADMESISKSGVHRVLTENLGMRNLCARWVPGLLTMEQKQRRDNVSIECLSICHSNKTDFLLRFITRWRKVNLNSYHRNRNGYCAHHNCWAEILPCIYSAFVTILSRTVPPWTVTITPRNQNRDSYCDSCSGLAP